MQHQLKYYKMKTTVEPAPCLLVDPFSTLTSIFLIPCKPAIKHVWVYFMRKSIVIST